MFYLGAPPKLFGGPPFGGPLQKSGGPPHIWGPRGPPKKSKNKRKLRGAPKKITYAWGGSPPPKPPRGGFEPKKLSWDDQSTGYLIFCPFRATFKFTWDKSLEMDIKAFTLKNVLFLILWGVFKENLPFFRGGVFIVLWPQKLRFGP